MVQGETMARLAAALHAEGIDVCQHFEGDGYEYASLPVIVFRGDDATGLRASDHYWLKSIYGDGSYHYCRLPKYNPPPSPPIPVINPIAISLSTSACW